MFLGKYIAFDKTLTAQKVKDKAKLMLTIQKNATIKAGDAAADAQAVDVPMKQATNPYAGLNDYSVQNLKGMGYSEKEIVSALTYLKAGANYSPIGEVENAIGYIQNM
jgi:hypothetical protein